MKENIIKNIIRKMFFPNGAIRRIAFGPLRGARYRVSPITGMETWHSAHEKPMQAAFERLVKKGDEVIDVGTNWGGHAIHLSKLVGDSGKVLAIEPSPPVANEAKWHFKENNCHNISFLEAALSDQNGFAYFDTKELSTQGKIISNPNQNTTVKVETITLDDAIKKYSFEKTKLIKVDVEGAEGNVLLGAQETLKKIRPIWVIELHTPEQDRLVSKLLLNNNYTLKRLNGDPILKPNNYWPDKDGVFGIIIAEPK